jgi:hypothetical protein
MQCAVHWQLLTAKEGSSGTWLLQQSKLLHPTLAPQAPISIVFILFHISLKGHSGVWYLLS